jgi:hypothetical protein
MILCLCAHMLIWHVHGWRVVWHMLGGARFLSPSSSLCAKRQVKKFLSCRLLETTANAKAIETLRHELEGSKKEVLLPLLVLVLVRSVLSYPITLLGQK